MVTKKDDTQQRAREGTIVQAPNKVISVTIWGSFIDEIKEQACYEFKEMKLKNLWGFPKLSSSTMTSIKSSKDAMDINWTMVQMLDWSAIEKNYKEKFYPTVLGSFIGCEVDIYPTCIGCNKKVNVPQNQERFSCPFCNKRLQASRLPIGFNGKLELEGEDDNNDILSLTFFADVFYPFLGKDFLRNYENKESIEDKILDLSDTVMITYSKNKKTITDIKQVQEKDELI